MSQSEHLEAFYNESMLAIREIAHKYALFVPDGLARVDRKALHWRLTVTECNPEAYWAELWAAGAAEVGITCEAVPGDTVVDQEGNQWILIGLDPASDRFPVRLRSPNGEAGMISAASGSLLQLISSAEPSTDL